MTQRPSGVRHWVVVCAAALAVITYMGRVSISFAALFEVPGGFLSDGGILCWALLDPVTPFDAKVEA